MYGFSYEQGGSIAWRCVLTYFRRPRQPGIKKRTKDNRNKRKALTFRSLVTPIKGNIREGMMKKYGKGVMKERRKAKDGKREAFFYCSEDNNIMMMREDGKS